MTHGTLDGDSLDRHELLINLANDLYELSSKHLICTKLASSDNSQIETLANIRELLKEHELSRIKQRFLLYAHIKDPEERQRIILSIRSLLIPPPISKPDPSKKLKAKPQEDLSLVTQSLFDLITKTDAFKKLPAYKKQSYIRKSIANISLLFNQALSEIEETTTLSDDDKTRYQQNAKYIRDRLNELRYNPFERFLRFNRRLSHILDNQSQKFQLNLAPYEIFDKGKQYIGLVKVAERLFGVQTAYILELFFHSLDPNHIPQWITFLKNSFFHHLNFALQFIDSVFFSTGALVTYRDKGFRKWSKVFFATLFLLFAGIPWFCALISVHVASVFFKMAAVLVGMVKTCLDMRYYYIKRSANRINMAYLKSKLISLNVMRNAFEEKHSKSMKGDLKQDLAELILEEFSLQKNLAEQKSLVTGNHNRIIDKQFAILVSLVSLVGMLIAACLPSGFLLIPSIIMLVLFTCAAFMKFAYRIYTFNRPDPLYDIKVDLDSSKRVFNPQKETTLFEKYFGFKETPIPAEEGFLYHLNVYRDMASLYKLRKKRLMLINHIKDGTLSKRLYYKQLLAKTDEAILKLEQTLDNKIPNITHRKPVIFDNPEWQQDDAVKLELIESALKFDTDLNQLPIAKALKEIADLNEDLKFYKRKVDSLDAQQINQSPSYKQYQKTQQSIDTKRQALIADKKSLNEAFEIIINKTRWFAAIDKPQCYLRLLMELYFHLPSNKKETPPFLSLKSNIIELIKENMSEERPASPSLPSLPLVDQPLAKPAQDRIDHHDSTAHHPAPPSQTSQTSYFGSFYYWPKPVTAKCSQAAALENKENTDGLKTSLKLVS